MDRHALALAKTDNNRSPAGSAMRRRRTAPPSPLQLAASIAERRVAGHSTLRVPPQDDEAAHFLRDIQFDRFAAGLPTSASSTITIRQLLALDPTYTAEAARVICEGVPGMDEAAAYPVQWCLNGLLQNVFEVSEHLSHPRVPLHGNRDRFPPRSTD